VPDAPNLPQADANALAEFGQHAIGALAVGIESVTGRPVEILAADAQSDDASYLVSEFDAMDHLGFEVTIALTAEETHPAALLLPLEEAGRLLGLDTSPEQMADPTFARGQLDAVSQTMRELLDLLSLTMFSGGLAGAEVTLAGVRRSEAERVIAAVAAEAGIAPLARVDFVLSLAEGGQVPLTLVVPPSLAARAAAGYRGEDLTPAARGTESDLDALGPAPTGDAPVTHGNISTFAPRESAHPTAPSQPAFARETPRPATPSGDLSVHPVRFPSLPETDQMTNGPRSIDLLMDVSMRVSVELGRSRMTVEEVLQLGPGSVVELDKLAGEPVDILVNERLIARGEVVVVDENFGVRVTEIVSPRQRATAMGGRGR